MNKIKNGKNNKNNSKIQVKIYSISEHLVNNPNCFENYDLNKLKIISKGRNEFHLKTLEAIYIFFLSKNGELC